MVCHKTWLRLSKGAKMKHRIEEIKGRLKRHYTMGQGSHRVYMRHEALSDIRFLLDELAKLQWVMDSTEYDEERVLKLEGE